METGDTPTVDELWPEIDDELTAYRDQMCEDLDRLIPIKSVYDTDGELMTELKRAARECADLLGGDEHEPPVQVIEIPDSPKAKHAPLVYADWPCGAPDARTVLLYAHYDVVSATDEEFTPGRNGRRITGRGSADDKSGVLMHVALCRALRKLRAKGRAPKVNIKIVLEGEEESGTDTLEKFVAEHPEMFAADVISLADAGNAELGEPTLTTSLRGVLVADVEVTTLGREVHSGVFGGPAPDAFMALTRMLAKLHDDDGNVAVPGLVSRQWSGTQPDPARFRQDATVLDGVRLIGTGTLGSRLYTKPSITVVALDGPGRRAKYRNVLQASAIARLSVRLEAGQDPQDAFVRLRDYLRRPDVNSWGALVTVTRVAGATGFSARTNTHGFRLAEEALKNVFGPTKEVRHAGQGASIPPASTLQKLFPDAAIVVWGCEEPKANIHAKNESVDIDEMYAMTRAQARLVATMADWPKTDVPAPRAEGAPAPASSVS